MEVITDTRQQNQQTQPSTNPVQDWANNSYSLSCDKFDDMAWTTLNGSSGVADPTMPVPNDGFAMDLGSDMYNMLMQSYDTTQFDTIVPTQISNTALDDVASSISSWPVSPNSPLSSHPATFSDIATDSTHTSPGEIHLDTSFSQKPRRHSHQQLHRSQEPMQHAGTKRRHSEASFHSTDSPAFVPKTEPPTSETVPAAGSNKKKKTIREKNRTAATKYRNKTKRSITELQETEHQLSKKNSILSAHVECLRNEILSLKTEILRHGTCESKVIQEYIMRTAKQL